MYVHTCHLFKTTNERSALHVSCDEYELYIWSLHNMSISHCKDGITVGKKMIRVRVRVG